jgi:hypothetical protein
MIYEACFSAQGCSTFVELLMTHLLQHVQQLPDDQVQELLNAAKAST